ncbi:MAG: LytTR family transcriptional regulator DNA-binding domain-containing protein, partial [Chitinophagales bacterium]
TDELKTFIHELDSVPIIEATAHYELQITQLRKQLEEERQKVFQKNHLVQSLTRQLGQVQQEYHNLLGQLQERKELPSVDLFAPTSLPQGSTRNPLPSINDASQTIYLLQGKQYHQIHTKDIAYLKPIAGGAICVLANGEMYRSELSMKDSLSKLPHSFMKIHRSYILNLRHLTSIDVETRKITLCKNIELSISTKFMQLLVERLKFLKKKDNR